MQLLKLDPTSGKVVSWLFSCSHIFKYNNQKFGYILRFQRKNQAVDFISFYQRWSISLSKTSNNFFSSVWIFFFNFKKKGFHSVYYLNKLSFGDNQSD